MFGKVGALLRTFSLLKGLTVFNASTGDKLGSICDLFISQEGLVKGLLLKKGALLKKTFLIDINDVSSFGWDGVMIPSPAVMKPIQKGGEYTCESHNRLTGKMLMTKEGEKLGLLEDVYFSEEVGTIVGYECTDGFFSDMLEGKHVIKTEEPPAIGKDAIIVNVK
ncbi:PRC-barrel domain-containing protein [Bacillus mesophilum]|uniref:PRC-barrel domain-containing protein n=1 Tax=Bacillus mesophilum TaxID=1071718 RepID=UPI0030842097